MTPGIRFDDSVRHRRLDRSAYDRVFVVGDVHGCRRTLERLVERIDPGEDDLLVFVGDLVRKGPDSVGVVDLVRSADTMLTVRGNNEEKVVTGEATVDGLTDGDHTWLRSLPHAISWDETLVVHGGVNPATVVQDPETLLSMRSPAGNGYQGPFWFDAYQGPPRTFFGHTVVEKPVIREWAVGLDTGCVYGGSLTAYEPDTDRVVSVEASETHQGRTDAKIVSPRRRPPK